MTQQPPGYGPSGQPPHVRWTPPPPQGYQPPPGYPPPGYPQPVPVAPLAPLAPAKPTFGSALFFVGGLLALMWAVETVDFLMAGALDSYGILPRRIDRLPAVLVAPLLHFGFGHLMANSLPFLALGTLTRMAGRREFWLATLCAVLGSGLGAWLLGPPRSITAGASGVIFGWLVFLLVRGLIARNWKQILLAAVVFGFFGGMLWGVFPTVPGVSWQAHLGGAVGGLLAAWVVGGRPKPRALTR
ncbi:MAG: rhomboid family intramembrane serine protease [Propioniciclava sp.]|uniref:rhomboid family intramembrane serine protease n=1 Tax=Propioniciclava sp. TaxID=2038686 RepID=UPI0039E614CF